MFFCFLLILGKKLFQEESFINFRNFLGRFSGSFILKICNHRGNKVLCLLEGKRVSFLFRELIYIVFFGKSKSLFCKVSKKYLLKFTPQITQSFFCQKVSSLKGFKKVLGKSLFSFPWKKKKQQKKCIG